MLLEEIPKSHDTQDSWKSSTPRLLEVTDSSKCNTTDIDWYMRMPKNPPPVDPKVEMPLWLHEQCEDKDATLKEIFSAKDNQFPH